MFMPNRCRCCKLPVSPPEKICQQMALVCPCWAAEAAGAEVQGKAESPQFWGGKARSQHKEQPRAKGTRNKPSTLNSSWSWDFSLPPQLFSSALFCRYLSQVQVWEKGGKKGEGRSQKTAACRWIVIPPEGGPGPHCLSRRAYANLSGSYENHMQMYFQLSKTVDCTC